MIEADHLGFAQRPDLVVNVQEGLHVLGIALEDENLDRTAFTRVVAKIDGHISDRSGAPVHHRLIRAAGHDRGRGLAAKIKRGKDRCHER